MKQVSIIIPHYNSVDLLRKLLSSIPEYKEIEIIVIDDNSTRGKKELVELTESNKFNHVKFMLNNTGVQSAGACRNIGLKHATGKWILFADSDDYFLDGFFKIIEKYFNSDYDVIFFNPISIYIDTNEVSNRHLKYRNLVLNYIKESSCRNESGLRYDYLAPWSKLIRKSIIEDNNIKFDEVLALNDVLFSTKVGYYINDFLASSEKIYCITRSKGTLTTTITNEIMNSKIDVFIRYCKFINKHVPKKQREHLTLTGLGRLLMVLKSGLGLKK